MVNAKTAATKGRETKLGKKSYEELIQIILKKDKVESRLNAQINSLKIENKALQNRVANFDKDQEGNVKAIGELKDRNKSLMEVITGNRVQIEELNQEINTYTLIAAEARDKVKALRVIACIFGVIAFVLTLILIF